MTGPAARGTERGTRAPSRVTGTQGAVGAVLVVLALGLALRLIIAYLLPGSGFGVDLGAFRAWAINLASQGLRRLLPARLLPRLHPGLSVRPVGARAHRAADRRGRRRPDQGAGDPRRPGHRLARLVDGPRARRAAERRPHRRVRRGRQPDQLVRQRGLGPGRLGRRGLPAARPARAVARPPGAVGDLRGRRRAHQAAARDPHPDPGADHDPTGALAGLRPGRGDRRRRRGRAPTANRRATAGSTGSAPGSAGPTIRSASSRPAWSPWPSPSCSACRSGCRSSSSARRRRTWHPAWCRRSSRRPRATRISRSTRSTRGRSWRATPATAWPTRVCGPVTGRGRSSMAARTGSRRSRGSRRCSSAAC